jgi:cbb3-type cytochrome oxidase maturation protein
MHREHKFTTHVTLCFHQYKKGTPMEALFMLIGFSLMAALVFLGFFLWAMRSGQFDDSVTPSLRVLVEDKKATHKS